MEAYNLQGGEYRKLAEKSLSQSCINLKIHMGAIWQDFLKYTNITDCPMDPVKY